MILVIRISGLVEVPTSVNETLHRIRIRRKYSAVLMADTVLNRKLLQTVRNFVAFGTIDQNGIKELLQARAVSTNGKKVDVDMILENMDKKPLDELGIKPFFRLHPARGGIDTKVHFPKNKGVLGDHKEHIVNLMRKML